MQINVSQNTPQESPPSGDKPQIEQLAKLHSLIFEASPVGIALVIDRQIISANRKLADILGYSPEEMSGSSTRLMYPSQEVYEMVGSTIYPHLAQGISYRNEIELCHKNGTIIPVTINAGYVDIADPSLGSIWIIENSTEKNHILEQLIHSQKLHSIGLLAGGLAHDLNNILSVINGYATLIQLSIDNNQQELDYVNEILMATDRAGSLTHSLLAYSRKQVMHRQNQSLNPLITTIGGFITRVIPENIRLTISLCDAPLVVHIDPVQIEQVLLNLANNARDAMPDGGELRISTSVETVSDRYGQGSSRNHALITVSDSGTGMDEDTKRQIFDPFFTTKEVGKGTGLGLSLVMGIINQHGGFIKMQSSPGNGTLFHLYLPLAESDELPSEPPSPDLQIQRGSGTILLAEDDPETLHALVEFLERAGYTIITAQDGQDAVEKFTLCKDEICLVISDVVMPRKSGKTACDEIRRISPGMKFIFVSGHAYDVIEREGTLSPDDELIIKPILPFDLLRKIKALL